MKVTPINCANCGSPVRVDRDTSLVTCSHCQTTMTIEWPDIQRRIYISRGAGSPFVICPVCRSQQIRNDDQADQQVACPDCGSGSIMPRPADYEFRVCSICGRAYESYLEACPDREDHADAQGRPTLF